VPLTRSCICLIETLARSVMGLDMSAGLSFHHNELANITDMKDTVVSSIVETARPWIGRAIVLAKNQRA
jgi:hypothetical protein